jgi:hypothetical protein
MSEPGLPILEYRGPATREPLPQARKALSYRIGLFCWYVPLLVGILVFILFEATRSDFLLICGLFASLGGAAMAGVGAICVLVCVATRWRRANDKWKEAVSPALRLIALLGSNFVVAAVFAAILEPC